MSTTSRPAAPATADESFRELFERLLQPAAPAAARVVRRQPPGQPPDVLIGMARGRAALQVERIGSLAELTGKARRALCRTDGGRSMLVEALADGACSIEIAGSQAPRRIESDVLGRLFPCQALYLAASAPRAEPRAAAHEPEADDTGAGAGITGVYLRLMGQLLALSTPIAMLLIIDKVVSSGARNTLVVLVAGVALLTLVQYLFLGASALQATREVELRSLEQRRKICSAVLSSRDAGDWTSAGWDVIVNTVESMRHRIETRGQFFADLAYVALLGVLMGAFSPLLLGVSAAFVPAYVAVSAWSAGLSQRCGEPLGSLRNELSGQYFESAAAAETVRGLDLAAHLADRWHDLDAASAVVRWRLAAVQRLAGQSVELLQKISLLIVMLLGVSGVLEGAMTLGQYIAFNLLSMQLAPPVLRLAAYRRASIEQNLRREAATRLLDGCREGGWPMLGDQPFPVHDAVVVHARGLRVGGADAARRVSFSLRSGAWLGIAGPSGCGKSTLLRTLAGLHRPAQGDVEVNGQAIGRFDAGPLARQVRLVNQHPAVFAGSIADNIQLGDLAAPPRMIVTVAQVCGLGALLAALPQHLDTRIGGSGRTLSSGEQQRIGIARAIMTRPAVLLLDEATAALDAASEERLLTNLRRFLPTTAVVLVSHRPSTLRTCDELVDLTTL